MGRQANETDQKLPMAIRIIGGGIVGLSVAYHLSQTTEDITVFEIDKSYERASFARSCGGMRSQFSTPANIAMSRHSIDFIQNQTDVEFTPNGYLLLFDASRAEDHDHSLALQQETGASTRSLAPEALQALYPELNTEGLYRGCLTQDGTEGWIDPIALHHWYRDQCLRAGVNIVYDDHRQYPSHASDITVICAGYWTRDVARHFGIEIPVQGEKHTVFQVRTERPVSAGLPLVADLAAGIYFRPEGEGYIAGYEGNNEGEVDDLEPAWASWDELWERLYYRFPGIFDRAKMTGAWSGYYDASTVDQNAIIDEQDGIYFATGFTGRGLMHSPAVGLAVSEMVAGTPLSFDLSAYQLNRASNREKYVI